MIARRDHTTVFDLYLVTDPESPFGVVAQTAAALRAVPAGRAAVQVRAKDYPTRAFLALARALRETTRRAGAALLVNDRVDIALLVEADGAQLTEASIGARDARALLGDDAIIGVSCHDAAGLERAAAGGATFATLSPVFPSPGKAAPLCLDGLRTLLGVARIPVLGLGGIDAANAATVVRAGAWGVAVVRAVYAERDAGRAASEILASLDTARAGSAQSH